MKLHTVFSEAFYPLIGYWQYKRRSNSASVIVTLYAALLCVLTFPGTLLLGRRESRQDQPEEYQRRRIVHGLRVDFLTFACVGVELIGLGITGIQVQGAEGPLIAFAAWRILDISAYAQRVVIFDRFIPIAMGAHEPEHIIGSKERVIIMSFINYLESGFCFAMLYWLLPSASVSQDGNVIRSGMDALYFSFITQLTIGYGDFTPQGDARWISITQGFLGTLYLTVVIARFIATLANVSDLSERQKPTP
jgi:hypothetical protein